MRHLYGWRASQSLLSSAPMTPTPAHVSPACPCPAHGPTLQLHHLQENPLSSSPSFQPSGLAYTPAPPPHPSPGTSQQCLGQSQSLPRIWDSRPLLWGPTPSSGLTGALRDRGREGGPNIWVRESLLTDPGLRLFHPPGPSVKRDVERCPGLPRLRPQALHSSTLDCPGHLCASTRKASHLQVGHSSCQGPGAAPLPRPSTHTHHG